MRGRELPDYTTRAEAEQLFEKAISLIPSLTPNGACLSNRKLNELQWRATLIKAEIKKEQEHLHTRLDEIAAAADYCKRRLPPRKTINHLETSYGYKHVVERWHPRINYCCNGAFIAAAVGLGFTFKCEHANPNPLFNLGKWTGGYPEPGSRAEYDEECRIYSNSREGGWAQAEK